MSSDAIVLLKADHKEIRRLFREFQATSGRATKKKAKIVARIIELLTECRARRKQLQELGAKLEQARKNAPRTPAQPTAVKKTIDALIA